MKEVMPNLPKVHRGDPLPKEVAERYVIRTWLEDAQMVHDGDKSKIYRVFERKEVIPGVGDGVLRVDARHWPHPNETLHRDQVRFEYVMNDPETGDVRLVAEMHLNELEDDAFWLQHRYVQPEFRGRKGVGSALLRQAEDWLRQVGEVQGHDVRLGLSAGQVDVFRWLQKQKFWIRKREKSTLDEILQYPEHFDIESATDDPNITQDLYVFRKEIKGRTRDDSVRLRFEKRISTGLPSPKTDGIMKHFVPSWDEDFDAPPSEKEAASVRIATIADAGDIARIHRESAVQTYINERLGITRGDMLKYVGDADEERLRWESHLRAKDPTAHTTILKIGDRTVGFCRVRRGSNIGHVEMLYLDPAYSGKGIGGEIFQESLQWLGDDQPIELEVASYNDRAIRFYERFGFRRQGYARPIQVSGGGRIPLAVMVRDRQEE